MSTDSIASAPRRALLHIALVLLPLAAFAPGLTSPRTHYDDPLYLDRPELAMPGSTGLSLLWEGQSAWSGKFVEYFPLRDSVYWLIFQQWETTALPYHLASLFFHIVATLLVFRLLEKLGQTFWVSAAAALLFAVHPIHVESVVWIAGLKDPLYTCFMLGSLLMYCAYRDHQSPRRYALMLALLIAALLTKSMALSTPLVMLAIERLIGQPTKWRTIFIRLAGPALLCAIFLAQFVLVGRLNQLQSGPHQGNWVAHVVLSLWAQVSYLRQAFFPSTFRLIYCFSPVESLADLRFFAGLGMLGAVGALVLVWREKRGKLFALAFYFACLLPVSNLIPFPAVMADRYLYAASIGSCLLIALLLSGARQGLKNTVLALAVAALAVTTGLRSAIWHDEEALWLNAEEDPACLSDPEYPAADLHFLRYLTAKDNPTRILALKRLLIARGVSGDRSGLRCEALLNGAQLLEAMGDHAEAERWAQLGVSTCGSHPLVAKTVLLVTMHHNLQVAAYAAEKWHRIQPSPVTRMFVLLTRLEESEQIVTRQEIHDLVGASPLTTCPILVEWSTEVNAGSRSAVRDALNACSTALKTP